MEPELKPQETPPQDKPQDKPKEPETPKTYQWRAPDGQVHNLEPMDVELLMRQGYDALLRDKTPPPEPEATKDKEVDVNDKISQLTNEINSLRQDRDNERELNRLNNELMTKARELGVSPDIHDDIAIEVLARLTQNPRQSAGELYKRAFDRRQSALMKLLEKEKDKFIKNQKVQASIDRVEGKTGGSVLDVPKAPLTGKDINDGTARRLFLRYLAEKDVE